MKKLFKRMFIFGLIFILNALFIFTIDAYNVFFDSNFIEDDYKIFSLKRSNEVMPRGNTLWKLNEYKKSPSPNVIIGDSKSMGFDTQLIQKITNKKYYNFGIPGGNYKSIKSIFWFANDNATLKNVFIQVGFGSYNKKVNYNLVQQVNPYLAHPFKMFFKSWFIFDSWSVLNYKLRKINTQEDEDQFLKNQQKNIANWDNIKQKQGYAVLEDHTYPENYFADLRDISEYCRENNINLTFIILPSHPDFYDIIEEMKLNEAREKFTHDMEQLGNTIDYSNSKELTSNKNLYIDIHHIKHSVLDSLSYEIWK